MKKPEERRHAEKEQMTEPQEEFITDEAVPSKDISETGRPDQKKPAAESAPPPPRE